MQRLNESRMSAVITDVFATSASVSMNLGPHLRHGTGLIIGLDSDVTVAAAGSRPVAGRAIVVPPNLLHTAVCAGPCISLLYDPETASEMAGFAHLSGSGSAFPLSGRGETLVRAAVTAHVSCITSPEVLSGLTCEAHRWLGKDAPRRSPDRRVARLLEALRYPLPDENLDSTPPNLGISDAHLRALFVRDVGLPIRTFRLWRRVLIALTAFARVDATAAAHRAGFSDLAHFSRTCRRMLGASPTELGRKLLKG